MYVINFRCVDSHIKLTILYSAGSSPASVANFLIFQKLGNICLKYHIFVYLGGSIRDLSIPSK